MSEKTPDPAKVNDIPDDKRKRLEMLICEGKSTKDAAFIVQTRKADAVAVRQQLEAEGKLDVAKVKRQIAQNLSKFAIRASERLAEEVDQMSPNRLAIDTAIAIDKLRDLAEGQQVVVERKITISQDEINNLLSATGTVKTIERLPLDNQE